MAVAGTSEEDRMAGLDETLGLAAPAPVEPCAAGSVPDHSEDRCAHTTCEGCFFGQDANEVQSGHAHELGDGVAPALSMETILAGGLAVSNIWDRRGYLLGDRFFEARSCFTEQSDLQTLLTATGASTKSCIADVCMENLCLRVFAKQRCSCSVQKQVRLRLH